MAKAVEYYAEHIDSINNVLLALDSEDAVSIDTAKTVTCDISVKNDLAHIQHTFSCIIKTLKSLQNRHLSLSESFEIINSTVEQLNRGRGKVADAVRAKVDTVLSKNPGYEELQKVVAVMSGESTVKINLDLSPADIVKLNYVPVTSCDVERSFSQYKSILRDNRRRFTFQHLKEMVLNLPLFSLTLRAWLIDVASAEKSTPFSTSETVQSAPQVVDLHYTRNEWCTEEKLRAEDIR
ncbi:hypothetical protein ANN_14749 [Periplaneta americana]|uniref:HAT C-terminal dimerisation domain-containing protein n=1 Tax=Periplaneta americana TaxID=6978 RepID=A0ABQ8SYR3_PERAM|nr:hypothetical protein ANN_14749 [Periplaneta americana]